MESNRRESQNSLENALGDWSAKVKLFEDEASRKSWEAATKAAFEKVEDLLAQLKGVTQRLAELEETKENLETKLFVDSELDEANASLGKDIEGVNLKIRWANDEKKSLFNDLEEALKIIEDKNRFIQAQEQDIENLTSEINEARELLENKKLEEQALKGELEEVNTEIEELRVEITGLDERIEILETQVTEKQNELAEFEAILNSKLEHVKSLEKSLGKATTVKFKPRKGDELDEMLADYLQMANCPIPIRRVGDGFYMFGSRKIYAKILNGKLVIRVGGGYMVIEKFIETYAEQEMDKLQRIAEKQGLEHWQ